MKKIFAVLFLIQYSTFGFARSLTTKLDSQIRTATQQACNDRYCYFVKQGRVYKSKRSESVGYSLGFSDSVKSVITFNGQLYAVQDDGKLWTWGEEKMCWIGLAKGVDKLQTDDKILFSISKTGNLSTYDGSSFSYNLIEYAGMTACSAENVLTTTSYSKVTEMSVINGKVSVVKSDGSNVDYYKTAPAQITIEPARARK